MERVELAAKSDPSMIGHVMYHQATGPIIVASSSQSGTSQRPCLTHCCSNGVVGFDPQEYNKNLTYWDSLSVGLRWFDMWNIRGKHGDMKLNVEIQYVFVSNDK